MGKTIFLTKVRQRFLIKWFIVPIIVVHLSLGLYSSIRNAYIKSNRYGAVLISDYAITKYDYWASPLAFLGAFPYWTAYFNNRGMKAKWFLRAKSTDLEKVIKDEKVESIVLVGHGSYNSWQAVDKLITNNEVKGMMLGKEKKKGEWIQLSCAVEDFSPIKMGELVMEKNKVYTYNNSVNTFIFITDALFGFKYLKGLNKL